MDLKDVNRKLNQQIKMLDEKILQLKKAGEPADLEQKHLCEQLRERVLRTQELANKADNLNKPPRTSAQKQMFWGLLLCGLSGAGLIGLLFIWLQN